MRILAISKAPLPKMKKADNIYVTCFLINNKYLNYMNYIPTDTEEDSASLATSL